MASPIFKTYEKKLPARNPLLYKDLRAISCSKLKVMLYRKGSLERSRDSKTKEYIYSGYGGLALLTRSTLPCWPHYMYFKAKDIKREKFNADPLTLKWLLAGVELSELTSRGVTISETIRGKQMNYDAKNRKVMNIDDIWTAYQGWYDWQRSSSDLPFCQFMGHKNPTTTMAVLDKRLLRRIGLSITKKKMLMPKSTSINGQQRTDLAVQKS